MGIFAVGVVLGCRVGFVMVRVVGDFLHNMTVLNLTMRMILLIQMNMRGFAMWVLNLSIMPIIMSLLMLNSTVLVGVADSTMLVSLIGMFVGRLAVGVFYFGSVVVFVV